MVGSLLLLYGASCSLSGLQFGNLLTWKLAHIESSSFAPYQVSSDQISALYSLACWMLTISV